MTRHPSKMSREDLEEEVLRLRADLGRQIDHATLQAFRERLRLSPNQARLVNALHVAKGRILANAAIMDALYVDGVHDEPDIKIVEAMVFAIRGKVGAGIIENVRGLGYKLSPAGLRMCDDALSGREVETAAPRKPATTRAQSLPDRVIASLAVRPQLASELARSLGVPKQTLHNALSGLKRDGLIDHDRLKGRGGASLHHLTEAGRALVSQRIAA